jgi:hypothetical protein
MSVFKLRNHLGSNFFPSAKVSESGQSSGDPYHLSSDDEEYLTSTIGAGMTPRQSNCKLSVLAATTLYLSQLVEAPMNCGQVNPYLNDSHTDPMEISYTLSLPNITDWWRQQDETH